MGIESLLNLGLALVVVLGLALRVATREKSRAMRQLLMLGLVLRVLGGVAYFVILETAYGGGDYNRYLGEGVLVFETTTDPNRADFSVIEHYGRWWGTPAVSLLTSTIMRVIGTDPVPLFMMFGAISFVGAWCFVTAFRRAFPGVNPVTYTTWVMLYPSLWFWSSPVGKDGPVLLGISLAFLGMVGLRRRRNYIFVILGAAITFVVRPQYALVLLVVLVGGLVLGRRRVGGVLGKTIAVPVLIVGVAFAATLSADVLGFDVTETEETSAWIEQRGSSTAYGGSAFEAAGNPITGIFNVLFRPFPWEASGVLMLGSSLEVALLWVLIFRRRQAAFAFVRRHWKTEPFWIAALFVIVLSAAAGMAVGNFGTLVRQRIHIYPFLFLITSAYPYARARLAERQAAQVRRGAAGPLVAGSA